MFINHKAAAYELDLVHLKIQGANWYNEFQGDG